ncbi:TetR/AcrR family transcriptional regulator [Solirubrobacter phytolaccae]|uniref:TetR/AcrR family transcriptional regulator n=1 Tax=Solirubrobacter phytolaccae TaxID=1404360 RepID=A0A9X3SBV0_9ACTN|nr:TetR-like C-terminal domain-containing protein [Solirubrobacter phytolaccae]MDA0185073.1 TetR/AcrR family transcriptional regulator [Solirubrobacter phytolaccae]
MSPKASPDLALRRLSVVLAAREIAESDGWPAVTMRRLAGALGATQPVLYTVFAGRQDVVDAVALSGFEELAVALEAVEVVPMERMQAYLRFATAHPRLYEAMFSMPSGLPFASDGTPGELRRAFAALREAFPDKDGTRAEVAWSALHGLATLQHGGRLRADLAQARLELTHAMLTRAEGL